MFKKLFFVFSIFFISFTMLKNKVYADELKLSEMSYEQKLAYLNENNIDIPNEYYQDAELEEILNTIFINLEMDINYNFNYNSQLLNEFANNIRESIIINDVTVTDTNSDGTTRPINKLLYNLVYDNGEWKDTGGDYSGHFQTYNCYSFAIDRVDRPNFFSPNINEYYGGSIWLDPGITQENLSENDWDEETVISIISTDLENFGYTNVNAYKTIPDNLDGKDLICYRESYNDYHFMKYDKYTDSWYHKPGNSAILKFIGDLEDPWVCERSVNGQLTTYSELYNEDIIYFTYDTNNIDLYNFADVEIEKDYSMCTIGGITACCDMMYEINVLDEGSYSFDISANNGYEVKLYDCIGRPIENSYFINENYENQHIYFNHYFLNGKYFIKISPLNNSQTLSINLKIKKQNYSCISSGLNDVTNFFCNENSSLAGYFKFYNIFGNGFLNINVQSILNGNYNNLNNNIHIFVYDDSYQHNIISNFNINETNFYAHSTYQDLNVYLPCSGNYYVKILIDDIQYDNIKLSISKEDEINFNLSNNLAESKFQEIFSCNNISGYFKKVTISHLCTVTLDCLSYGSVNNNIPVFIFKEQYDEEENIYYLDNILYSNITNQSTMPEFQVTLNRGDYYFGYLNNLDSLNITFAIERLINPFINVDAALITDPALDQGYPVGTEVLYNNGICNGNTITEGFTRNMFIVQSNDQLYPISRLEYYWFSSDERYATVTNYGTILAQAVNETKVVIIYAILKTDPTIVFRKTLTILNDINNEPLNIYSTMNYSYSEENGNFQIELNYNNSPYPYIQYYSWDVVINESEFDLNIMIDCWGFITSDGCGRVLLIGTYILNSRVQLIIDLTILE